jgi:hypothetical protein
VTSPLYLPGWDATSVNVASVPAGLGVPAGYATGSSGIPWTLAQWWTYPEAIVIDQSAYIDDVNAMADVFDVENGAITNADGPALYQAALAAFSAATRPGQRYPAFYTSQSNLTALCNEFVAAGITAGPRLVVADWGIGATAAQAMLAASGGPFPVVGVQYASQAAYDCDLWLASWVYGRSAPPAPAPPAAPVVTGATITFSDGTTQTLTT